MIRAVGRSAGDAVQLSTLCRSTYTTCNHQRYLRNNAFRNDGIMVPKIVAATPPTVQSKSFHTEQPCSGWFSPKDDITFWGRTLTRLGFTETSKSTLMHYGNLTYMKVADNVDYLKFFERCSLPDTFASWYAVVELHVWLLSARLVQNGKEGQIVRNAIITAMWEDCENKSKKLEGALPSARRRDIQTLNEQFLAALISYDEGLMGDDYILAGALWRRLLHHDSDPTVLQPQHFDADGHNELEKRVKTLEMLVIYVRSQYYMLNGLTKEQIIRKRIMKWAPFDDSLYQLESTMTKSPSSQNVKAFKMR